MLLSYQYLVRHRTILTYEMRRSYQVTAMQPDTTETQNAVKDLNGEACTVVDTLDAIGSKWRLLILYDLQVGEKRFNEIKRSTGVSSSTLSRVLNALQDEGLVTRRLEEAAPVAVYYRLSDKGEALEKVFDTIDTWGTNWLNPPQS